MLTGVPDSSSAVEEDSGQQLELTAVPSSSDADTALEEGTAPAMTGGLQEQRAALPNGTSGPAAAAAAGSAQHEEPGTRPTDGMNGQEHSV
jgi:hypothetical protein